MSDAPPPSRLDDLKASLNQVERCHDELMAQLRHLTLEFSSHQAATPTPLVSYENLYKRAAEQARRDADLIAQLSAQVAQMREGCMSAGDTRVPDVLPEPLLSWAAEVVQMPPSDFQEFWRRLLQALGGYS